MNKEQFSNDIQKIYDFITEQKAQINKLYEYLEKGQDDKLTLIDDFAKHLELTLSDDLKLALITRVVNLRDDGLVQVLKKLNKTDNEIIGIQEQAYQFVKEYWLDIHNNTINFITTNNLLTPFYQEVFKGVYSVGVEISKWQTSWTKMIINGVNKDLLEKFDGDDEKVMQYLESNELFDKGHDGITADRSYSMLVKKDDSSGEYKSASYIESFKKEVTSVIDMLEEFVDNLIELEDDIYNQKWEHVQYLQAIITALAEKRCDELVSKWADVDSAWMKLTGPIQIGHPLEYYEDHFRKAVALEWDIRLTNPSLQNNNQRVQKIKSMFSKIYDMNEDTKQNKDIYNFSLKSLDKVQLHLGRPALFFGAEFNGLFSAQVVPNDEKVSAKDGKKIFAFSDEILQGQRAKPFLKLSTEILGQEFLTSERKFLFNTNNNQKWHQVYDITTIGHEFGHILWCDEETETVMNKTANFKNIEEFKATTGGLVSFFLDENSDEKDLEEFVLSDTIKRAIGLIAWMEVDEVQPYYCEGLIHLNGLFESKVLTWDEETEKLTINQDKKLLENLKQWYIDTYNNLAKHYLDKKDASEFLNIYAIKKDKYYSSTSKNIDNFIQYYFRRYKQIGQELDTNDNKENYK
ncbi:MAG: invasion protein CiaB [Campylobacterota bacterium]|nr:invasion protein CiaB [Campylobacterota bacterium]